MSAQAPGETRDKDFASSEPGAGKSSQGKFPTFEPSNKLHINALAFFLGFAALIALIAFASLQFLKSHDGNVVEISGRIEAPETRISAVAATRVKSVLVREGDNVTKGQLLIQLDTGVIQAKAGNVQQFISQASRARQQADLHAAAMAQQVAQARKKSNGFWTKVFTSPEGRAKKASNCAAKCSSQNDADAVESGYCKSSSNVCCSRFCKDAIQH